MSMPGTFVGIVGNRLRALPGASGFMSNVSCWGGPPSIYSKMQDLADPFVDAAGSVLARAFAANNSGNDTPTADRLPACSQVRRDMGVNAFSIAQFPHRTVRFPINGSSYHRSKIQ